MKKIKVISVFGTRPEAIKMAPLCKELETRPQIESKILVTAQHRGMLDTVMSNFGISADYDLDVMQSGQTLCGIVQKSLSGLEAAFAEFKPDCVLVHGDTTTTLAAALAAFYCGCRVGHVEAGLRTFDKFSPYPEEVNRMVTGDIAELHFAPTVSNAENLKRENIKNNIFITGNTVIDALKYTVRGDYVFENEAVAAACAGGNRLALMTAHRRENLGEPHRNIFRAVKRFALERPDYTVIYPVHPNPKVKQPAYEILGGLANVVLCDPVDTAEMHNLMNRVDFILTDSGGIQEEGPALGKPVLVLRTETERPEAVAAGTVKLSGVSEQAVLCDALALAERGELYERMARAVNPYGDGRASERIADAVLYCFGAGEKPVEFGCQR